MGPIKSFFNHFFFMNYKKFQMSLINFYERHHGIGEWVLALDSNKNETEIPYQTLVKFL